MFCLIPKLQVAKVKVEHQKFATLLINSIPVCLASNWQWVLSTPHLWYASTGCSVINHVP